MTDAGAGVPSEPQAAGSQDASLDCAVREYWNHRIHDLEIARSPVGTAEFFRELDAYRFEKLNYLPRLVDFNSCRGRRVLEIGCGIGTDLARFAQAGARVTGVDLSEMAIELAGKNLTSLGLKGDLRVADGAMLPFADNSFDLVYCHGVLQYASNPLAIVREAHRMLADEGQAVFMVYNRRSWLSWMSRYLKVGLEHGDAPVLRLYTAREFDRMLTTFPTRRIEPERFPVTSRLHRGLKGWLYNNIFVRLFDLIPRRLARPLGWHLMAFCSKG